MKLTELQDIAKIGQNHQSFAGVLKRKVGISNLIIEQQSAGNPAGNSHSEATAES